MNNKVILLIVVGISSVSFMVGAADAAESAAENARLRNRVENLDREVEELKKALGEKEQQTQAPPLHPILSSLDIQLYGYIKLDAAYDTSQTDDGNFAKWVEREDLNPDDDQFNMTANQSRFGIRIKGTGEEAMQTSGRAEVDFYGGGSQNKAHLMMRHAYMKLDWPDERFSIIAGQTSDVISPLVPMTVNYSVNWWVGNMGYRRPQIRLTKVLGGLEDDVDLTLEGAVARSIGRDDAIDATESGEDSGRPTLQGRISATAPVFASEPSTIGVSGHYANEEYDVTATGSNKDFRSWSVNLDFLQPLNDWLTIKSELFTGENLNAYLGGIGQGVTLAGANMFDEIGSSGGWIAASLGPWDGRRYNIGVGMDDVDAEDVNAGARTLNRSIFANMFYSLNKNTEFALELSHWRTEYDGPGDADNFRVQTAFIYKF